MKISIVTSGPVSTNAYVLSSDTSETHVVVDVPLDSYNEIMQLTAGKVSEVWLTHSHWDHVGDLAKLCRATGAKVYLHSLDLYRLEKPNDYIGFGNLNVETWGVDFFLDEISELSYAGEKFQVIHTPGHTEGGVCFYSRNMNIALVGDTIFKESIGRTDLIGGNFEQLIESIKSKVYALPDECTLLPGHGEHTQVSHEKQFNPFT